MNKNVTNLTRWCMKRGFYTHTQKKKTKTEQQHAREINGEKYANTFLVIILFHCSFTYALTEFLSKLQICNMTTCVWLSKLIKQV